jgi:phosphatidylserine/phosphatidylglycerophosphate/cardiolipin synthase-like enzyme
LSTSAAGRLADENNRPWEGFTVAVSDARALFHAELASAKTNDQGQFSLSYLGDSFAGQFGHRQLELTVSDKVRRVVLHELLDDTDAQLTLNRTIKRADGEGLLVTLGKGTPRFVSQGNAVTLLMDKDAFEHASKLFKEAEDSIFVSQLLFALPAFFDADATHEIPELIFAFHVPEPTAGQPRAAGMGDDRPERLLLAAADLGVDVRILLHQFRIPLVLRLLIGAISFALGGTDGLFSVSGSMRESLSDIDKVRKYFNEEANRAKIRPHEFTQSPISAGVLHAKLVVVDGKKALSIGSPFGQSYVDTHEHLIDAPRRGKSTGFPKHDAGFGVTGPAVADIHETARLLWNTAVPADQLQPIQPPDAETDGADAVSAMQLVRTLSAGRFEGDLAEGEKGILEAYQRAIGNAREFIYIETQYFTNDAIGGSLVEAMKANHDLQVILLCNIEPDVPTYPFKQRRLITRIRKAVGPDIVGQRPRFGIFTRWTHEVGTPRPRILPIYVHAKAAVVDDTWATIGSANLDGLSLDSSLLSDVLHKLFGATEQRAIEVNGVFLNGVAGQPQTDLVDRLRRKLFAEHLNFASESDPALLTPPPDGWLGLWQRRAMEKNLKLVNRPKDPETSLAHVLPWPEDDTTHKTPRKHLNALGVLTHKIVPLKSTQPFLFDEGKFDDKKQAEMDYD